MNRFVYVAETNEEAVRDTRDTVMRFIHRGNSVIRDFLMLPQEQITYELLFNEVCIFGDADHCARRLLDLAKTIDLRELIVSFNYFTIPHDKCARSMRRFVEDVLPPPRSRRGGPDVRFGMFVMGTAGGSYQAILEQACRAEDDGFASVLLAERHFGHGALLFPSPLCVGAAIAARTRRLRIATAGRILPLAHPVRVAEDAATLDVLSGGRLDFGVTRASLDGHCHDAFASPVEESRGRFEEALEIIVGAWTRERFSYEGRYYKVPEVTVSPRPVQRPHPPVYLVAVSPETLRFAGRKGYPVLLPATRSVAEVRDAAVAYRDHATRGGSRGPGGPRGRQPVRVRVRHRRAAPAARSRGRSARSSFETTRPTCATRWAQVRLPRSARACQAFDRWLADFCVFGSPETVTARLRELHDRAAGSTTSCVR